MNEIKIAMVLSTGGLDYDDRIKKEMLSIQKLYPNVSFKVFAMLPQNKEVEGISSYGIPYKSIYLKARDKYAPATKTLLKGYQLYKAVKDDLKSYDAIWTADVETVFVTMLAKTDRLIWDLHELPMGLMDRWWMRMALKYMFSRCKVVLHASPYRIKCLNDKGLITHPENHYALCNFQSKKDDIAQMDDNYNMFVRWRKNKRCVYLQGLGGDDRASYETISAIMGVPDLYAVVLGKFDKDSLSRLEKEFKNLHDRIYFTGLILQQYIGKYVEQCYMSVIFYKNVNLNNWYCDSNRLYLSLLKSLPVVVGNNPSMKAIVDEYGLGVSIDDDGRDVRKIEDGIMKLIENYDIYKKNVLANKDLFVWESQEGIMKEFMNKLLK